MSTTCRNTHPCASAQSSLSFHTHAVQASSSPSPAHQPVDSTPPPITGEKRNCIAAFGAYDDPSPQPRKKRKLANNIDTSNREHAPKIIAVANCKMVDLVGVVKLHESPMPPTSPPDLKIAILRTGPQTRSASPSTESASVPPPFSPAVRPLTPPFTLQGTPQSTPPSTDSPRSRLKTKSRQPTVIPLDSLFVPMPGACDHTLHPAYASSYIVPLCPRCRLEFALDQLRVI
jgi:hypothetical protein